MKEFELKLKNMSCGSCEKVIRKAAENNQAKIKEIDIDSGRILVECEEDRIEPLIQELAEKGFGDGGETPRGDPGRVKKYILAVIGGDPQVEVETTLMNYSLASIAVLAIIGAIGYGFALNGISAESAYLPILVLTGLSSVIMVFSYHHMDCYRKTLSCTNGMMIGMTMGMMSGFMSGALVGATNGMFIGSTAGVAVGILFGGNLGRYGGIMGAMEGIMAGLMSGTMGAMLSVMMINDNLMAFLYLLFAMCAVLVGGLSYMMHRKAGPVRGTEFKTTFVQFLFMSVALAAVMAALMLLGPKGPVTYP